MTRFSVRTPLLLACVAAAIFFAFLPFAPRIALSAPSTGKHIATGSSTIQFSVTNSGIASIWCPPREFDVHASHWEVRSPGEEMFRVFSDEDNWAKLAPGDSTNYSFLVEDDSKTIEFWISFRDWRGREAEWYSGRLEIPPSSERALSNNAK